MCSSPFVRRRSARSATHSSSTPRCVKSSSRQARRGPTAPLAQGDSLAIARVPDALADLGTKRRSQADAEVTSAGGERATGIRASSQSACADAARGGEGGRSPAHVAPVHCWRGQRRVPQRSAALRRRGATAPAGDAPADALNVHWQGPEFGPLRKSFVIARDVRVCACLSGCWRGPAVTPHAQTFRAMDADGGGVVARLLPRRAAPHDARAGRLHRPQRAQEDALRRHGLHARGTRPPHAAVGRGAR
jgi:hypothetical protein